MRLGVLNTMNPPLWMWHCVVCLDPSPRVYGSTSQNTTTFSLTLRCSLAWETIFNNPTQHQTKS